MYINTLTITTSELNILDKIKDIMKDINYEITLKYCEYNEFTKQIIYSVFKIETYYNIRKFLIDEFSKNFNKYPTEILKLMISNKERKSNKYFILSKLKQNKNYFSILTEYTSRVNPKILY